MARKSTATSKKGNLISKKRIGFTFIGKPGSEVFVAGSFNGWDVASKKAKKMVDTSGNGTYTKILVLALGRYEYKFMVDGEWVADDKASWTHNEHGTLNSVLELA